MKTAFGASEGPRVARRASSKFAILTMALALPTGGGIRWHLCWGYLEFETAPLGGRPQNFIEAPTGESHPLPRRRPPALVTESCGRRSGTRSSSWLFLVANRGSR